VRVPQLRPIAGRAVPLPTMLVRRVAAATVVALVSSSLGACSTVAAPGGTAATRPASAQSDAAPRSAGGPWPATGPLFNGPADDLGEHFCTASVIDAPGRNVVLTAAHCVASGDGTPPRTGMSFVPGYHGHLAPFASDCERHENGMKTAPSGGPPAGDGPLRLDQRGLRHLRFR